MARPPQDVTPAELAVLELLWDGGPASRRHLADVLYPDGAAARYTTVQKLLERLEAKGCVTRRDGETVTFAAAVARDELISRRLREVADKLCGGSLTPLLMNLMRSQPLSDREIDELQALVERLKAPPVPNDEEAP